MNQKSRQREAAKDAGCVNCLNCNWASAPFNGVADRYNTALILRDSSPFATLYHLTITASYYGIFHEITARHFSAFCCIFYDWTSDRRHHLPYFANYAHRLAARRFVGGLRPEPVHYRQKNRFSASALNRNPTVLRNRCMVLSEACHAYC